MNPLQEEFIYIICCSAVRHKIITVIYSEMYSNMAYFIGAPLPGISQRLVSIIISDRTYGLVQYNM